LRRPIIILGMHRSGTSLIAEMVQQWGAFGGDEFLASDSRNPRGYWEYAPLVHFNRRLLVSVGSQSFVPPSDQDERTLRARASEPEWKRKASQLVAAMEKEARLWYWKDPRLAVTLPFWQQFWAEAVYVIAVREPLDTALSLKKRDNLPVTAGLLLWQRYMTSILRHAAAVPQRIFVQYERLLSTPVDECTRLCNFLEEHSEPDGTSPISQHAQSMLEVVTPGLRSHASNGKFLSASEATGGQKSLYRYLQSRAQDQDELLDPKAFEIYPGWRDYLQALATLEQVRDTLAQKEQALLARIQRKLSHERPVNVLPW
jgi:hypothetical protein